MSIWKYVPQTQDVTKALVARSECLFCNTSLSILPTRSESDRNFSATVETKACSNCGWWTVYARNMGYHYAQEWGTTTEGAVGILRELDLSNINQPLDEVRAYLAAKYDKRFEMHPRLFEMTVASVFKGLGYQVGVTGYSRDGGIDVILDGPDGEKIGVQVKRYRKKIKVEQIRALAGSLFIGRYTRGVFVTTSSFQSGASSTSELAKNRGLPIELVDAEKFYGALKIAQRNAFSWADDETAPYYQVKRVVFDYEYGSWVI